VPPASSVAAAASRATAVASSSPTAASSGASAASSASHRDDHVHLPGGAIVFSRALAATPPLARSDHALIQPGTSEAPLGAHGDGGISHFSISVLATRGPIIAVASIDVGASDPLDPVLVAFVRPFPSGVSARGPPSHA